MIKFARRIEKKEKFIFSSYGYNNSMQNAVYKPGHIANFDMIFRQIKPIEEVISIDKARCDFISILTSFLNDVNTDEKLRDLLDEYPFDGQRVALALCYDDENEIELSNGGISWISLHRGIIEYIKYDIIEYKTPVSYGKHHVVHTESVEDAIKIVNEQKCLRSL
jgi:hypothetical protein